MKGGIKLNKKVFLRFVCALLFFVLTASFISLFSKASSDEDYSYPYATLSKEIYADEFLKAYLPEINLTDIESDYLRLQSGFLLAYNCHIPTNQITTSYTNGRLTVTASEYTYTAVNGTVVVWTPVSATVYEKTKNFYSSPYSVEFSGLTASDGDSVKVKYSASFVISKERIDRLVNMAYTDAPRLEAEIASKKAEYEREHNEYLINTQKYNEYLASLAEYNEYLTLKKTYDARYAEYLVYLEEKADYDEAKALYDAYIFNKDKYHKDLAKYIKYLAYAEQNLAKIEAYEKYQQKFDTVLAQLDAIKKAKTPLTDLKRTVYSAIMGDTVTAVIDRKGDIVKVLGADAKVVDVAGVATENLRVLLKEFFDLKNTQEQYQYYIANYEAFRDNFANLLKALDNLYLVNGVRGAMIAEEKHEKYLILVAQLYYIANALSDEPITSYDGKYLFDSTYQIGSSYSADKRYYPGDVINNEPFIADSDNASPLPDGFPIAPEKPEYTFMTEPVMPSPVSEPIAPDPMDSPVAPTPVLQPAVVKRPGKEPNPYVTPTEVQAIIDAYNRGELSLRSSYTGEDITVSPEITVNKMFLGAEEITVTYYDKEYTSNEKKSVLYRTTIDKGSYADYLGRLPEKNEDAEYLYYHSGWTDGNGNEPDFSNITENINLYPKFSTVQKEYDTVWVVTDEVFYENPGTPSFYTDEYYFYSFSAWEKSVDPHNSDVTYNAVFDKKTLVPTLAGPAKVTFQNGNYIVESPGVSNKFDIDLLLIAASGNGGITIKCTTGEELAISYTEVIEMQKAGVASISYSAVQRDSEGYAYAVTAYDKDNSKLACDAKLTFKAACSLSDISHAVIYYEDNGDKKTVRSTIDNGRVTFLASLGKTYYAGVVYTLTPVPLEAISIKTHKTIASPGEAISVVLTYSPGIRIDRIYAVGTDGVKIDIVNSCFKMPAYDVTIGVDYTVEQYTVTFVAGGKTIATYLCNYGDTVIPPQPPKKASNESYSYTFEKWTPSVTEVTGNITYVAVYSSLPLPQTDKDNMSITPSVLKLLLLAFIGLGCLAAIVIPSSVMTGIMVKKRKKSVSKLQNGRKNK